MKKPTRISSRILERLPAADLLNADRRLEQELASCNQKIVVLDDDPTGVQTVHDVLVYTDWRTETLIRAFEESNRIFFILTNSRGMTVPQTEKAHREIAAAIDAAARSTGKDFILVSRSDSTLRGHYPLETALLRDELEALGQPPFDGEIIYPFFKEGGRFTLGNVHYVKERDELVPAGQTEFARDRSFPYHSSNLVAWCEEKSNGTLTANQVTCISLEDLRTQNYEKIIAQLMAVQGFGKVIVNSADYVDVKVFVAAFLGTLRQGKRFLFRSASAVPKVIGGVEDRPLLSREEMVPAENQNGGIVIAGSHVNKTTQQLDALKNSGIPLEFIEFNQHLVVVPGGLEREVQRVSVLAQEKISAGRSVVVYTRRDRLDLPDADADRQLEISMRISDAVTSVIAGLMVRPGFIIAKGGITSSDVGTKALKVRRAVVLGQISPGIPVWRLGAESKFPGMPYVIFPGNVGDRDTLRKIVEALIPPVK